MRIAIIFNSLGPYHISRLNSIGKHIEVYGIEVTNINNSNVSNIICCETEFEKVTLFDDNEINQIDFLDICSVFQNEMKKINPEVVVIPGWSAKCAIIALKWCVLNKVPAVVMSDSFIKTESLFDIKERVKKRIISLFSSALVAGTVHFDYLKSMGVPENSIYKGYDVVDNEHFSNTNKSHSKYDLPDKYFISVSRFVDEKNIINMLKAYSIYRKKNGSNSWKFVLVGDGYLKKEIEKFLDTHNLHGYLILPGFKRYDELPIYYGFANAFILASVSETWGLVVNEAMASGLPVLVSEQCGCVTDLVKKNGFSFDPYNVDEIEGLMQKISSGECNLELMGNISKEIISKWSLELFATNLLKAAHLAKTNPEKKLGIIDRVLLWVLKYI